MNRLKTIENALSELENKIELVGLMSKMKDGDKILIMDVYESKRDYFENVVTLTYDGKMKPHIVKQHMKKNYNCEHFEIISDREETTFRGMTNPATCEVKILNCT